MRSDWKTIIVVFLLLFMFCAKPKSKWLKWQESLDLAYPNELSFKIDMQKKNFFEGEPIVFRMIISNKLDIPKIIVHPGERAVVLAAGWQTFKVVTEFDSVLMYSGYVHANLGMQSVDAIVLEPYDTLYFYAILCPDLFKQYDFPMERVNLSSGDYIIESNIHLGTKFYPRPARGLFLTSHPTLFSIEPLPADEKEYLSKIRPYLKNFFGHAEECFFPLDYEDNNYERYVDSALFWLDHIRKTDSHFTTYADFVYTCIPAITRTYNDTIKLNRSISEANMFIKKYPGSILSEEMEFKLAWWLFLKDSTSSEFKEYARSLISKYPKNINAFGIKKHIHSGL